VAGVHDEAVLPPERDDGEIVRRPALDAGVDRAASGRIEHLPAASGEPVHHGGRVAAPVVARGRAHGRVEGQVVEVRIPDPHPRQRAHLEVAVADVCIEGAPLVGAHVERDADGGELRLDRLRQATRPRLGRRLVDQPEAGKGARAVRIAVAGPIEQSAGTLRVVTQTAAGRERPVLGREQAGGGPPRTGAGGGGGGGGAPARPPEQRGGGRGGGGGRGSPPGPAGRRVGGPED